ncbi:MAG: copper chaperone PCu(A)C [Hyphomicrobiales bacterium]
MAFAALLAMEPLAPGGAAAHGYRFGDIEIVHPAIRVPSSQADCTCAHLKIINHGNLTEYFLGARIDVAGRTELMQFAEFGRETSHPARVAIPPGGTLDLHRHSWCLFMSGLKSSFEADLGVYSGTLLFERAGNVEIEFMVDEAAH